MIYLIIGCIWAFWLEYYTTNEVNGPMGRPWIMRERLFHLLLWPFSLLTFITEIIRQLWK